MAAVTPTVAAATPPTTYRVQALRTALPTIASLEEASTGLTDAQLDDMLVLLQDIRTLLVNAGIAS